MAICIWLTHFIHYPFWNSAAQQKIGKNLDKRLTTPWVPPMKELTPTFHLNLLLAVLRRWTYFFRFRFRRGANRNCGSGFLGNFFEKKFFLLNCTFCWEIVNYFIREDFFYSFRIRIHDTDYQTNHDISLQPILKSYNTYICRRRYCYLFSV